MSPNQTAGRVLDGKWVRDQILAELKPRIEKLTAMHRPPGLAVILVGNDPGSEIFVRLKIKTCGELGIYSEKITPPETITTGGLLGIIEGLNQRPEIDGILVQTPLPPQVDKDRVLRAMNPNKDVDGLHPLNVGALVENIPAPRACTPRGHHGNAAPLRHPRVWTQGRGGWPQRSWSENRWRCCCCTPTPP